MKRSSEYEELVSSMQGPTAQKKVHPKVKYLILSIIVETPFDTTFEFSKASTCDQVGRKNGLRLVLDLHSNAVSFGTLEHEYAKHLENH